MPKIALDFTSIVSAWNGVLHIDDFPFRLNHEDGWKVGDVVDIHVEVERVGHEIASKDTSDGFDTRSWSPG